MDSLKPIEKMKVALALPFSSATEFSAKKAESLVTKVPRGVRLFRRIALFFATSLCVFFIILRPLLPNRDFPTYSDNYLDPSLWKIGVDFGFQLLVELGHFFSLDHNLFFFLVSAFAVVLKLGLFYFLSECFLSTFLIYFSFLFWLHDMTQLRLAFSQPFVLIAIMCATKRHWFFACFSLLIAVSIHSSNILAALLFLSMFGIRPWIVALLLSSALLFFALSFQSILDFVNPYLPLFVSERISLYSRDPVLSSGPVNVFTSLSLVAFLVFLLLSFGSKISSRLDLFLIRGVYALAMLLSLLLLFVFRFEFPALSVRGSEYFWLFLPLGFSSAFIFLPASQRLYLATIVSGILFYVAIFRQSLLLPK